MRNGVNGRRGYDRVLMAVAATFLTISAGQALAQSDGVHKSAADLAIEAAVPMPEPANVPPPTAGDFKLDSAGTTASVSDSAKIGDIKAGDDKATDVKAPETKAADTKPADIKPQDIKPSDMATAPVKPDAATPAAAAAPAAEPAKEPVKAASNVPPADQPVADKLREAFSGKTLRTFDRKADRAAAEKFYAARDY